MNIAFCCFPFQNQSTQRQEVSNSGGGLSLEWERFLLEAQSLQGSLLEQANRPKPFFFHRLPCGLNCFRSTVYPRLAADRSGILPPLHMATAKEAALLFFFLLTWKEQMTSEDSVSNMSMLAGGLSQHMCSLCERFSRSCDRKWDKRVNEVWGEGGSICPIQICLIGFDFHNYRVIMAFSVTSYRSESQLLYAPTYCQMVWVTERVEQEMGKFAMDFDYAVNIESLIGLQEARTATMRELMGKARWECQFSRVLLWPLSCLLTPLWLCSPQHCEKPWPACWWIWSWMHFYKLLCFP